MSAPAEAGLRVERDGAIVRLVLDRPSVGNAIDLAMARALFDAAVEADEDDAVRCVVLTGAGRLFCAGGDVAGFAAAGERLPQLLKRLTGTLHSAIARLARMSKPLLTIVNGPAAGAGFSLAVLGDVVIMSSGAHFTLAYTGLGLSPDGGATWLLPRLVGLRRAQELALTNRCVDAHDAVAMGLATRAVAPDVLDAEGAGAARALASAATLGIGETRRLLLDSFSTTLETQMEHEARAIARLAATPHGREGVAAFVARRAPDYL